MLRTEGGSYFAYVDGIDLGGALPVVALTSSDLVTWSLVGGFVVDPGAWADPSSGSRFTSPSVRYVAGNPAASRYVMYLSGPTADGAASCIGVATAAAPEGPFVGADQPLICPPGGARAASPVPGSDQVVYRAEMPTSGVYGLTLDAAGTAVAPGAVPSLLLGVAGGIGQEGVLERPAVAPLAEGPSPLGYGVIGSTTGSGPVSLGSSPSIPAKSRSADRDLVRNKPFARVSPAVGSSSSKACPRCVAA